LAPGQVFEGGFQVNDYLSLPLQWSGEEIHQGQIKKKISL